MESDHERSMSILQNELENCRQEFELLKIRFGLLQQTNIDYEKRISNLESSQIGINSHFSTDDTPACRTSEYQQEEVTIRFILFNYSIYQSFQQLK